MGSYIEPVDPDLKGQYSDELILGVETTVPTNYVLGAKYIRRYIGRAIEDSLDVNSTAGDYFIMNPGVSQTRRRDPRAVRDYKGVEVSMQKKFTDHYTWQSAISGASSTATMRVPTRASGADGTGQLDPNINSAFDEPDFIVNSAGRLSGDRTHQVKGNGYYEWDFGLSLAPPSPMPRAPRSTVSAIMTGAGAMNCSSPPGERRDARRTPPGWT